jgi:hypothetical protein
MRNIEVKSDSWFLGSSEYVYWQRLLPAAPPPQFWQQVLITRMVPHRPNGNDVSCRNHMECLPEVLVTLLWKHIISTLCIVGVVIHHILTSWSRVLLEKLTDFAASQEIFRIYGTRSVRHLSLS